MKKFALLSVVLFTTLTVQSCRQSDELLSPEEAATLQKVLESSDSNNNTTPATIEQNLPAASVVDGETAPPPKK